MNEKLFTSFYETNHRSLVLYIRKLGAAPDIAEDIAHESWIRFYKWCSDENDHWRGSLYTIARRCAVDYFRGFRRAAECEPTEHASLAPGPEASIRAEELRSILLACTLEVLRAQGATLPASLDLFDFLYDNSHDPKSRKVLAATLGVSLGILSGIRFRIRKKARDRVQEYLGSRRPMVT